MAVMTSETAPTVEADSFRGVFTLATCMLMPVETQETCRFELRGDGSRASVLALNNQFWVQKPGTTADTVWRNKTQPRARGGLIGSGPFDDRGGVDDATIIRHLAPLRSTRPWVPAAIRMTMPHVLGLWTVACLCCATAADWAQVVRCDPLARWTDNGQLGIMLGGEPHGGSSFWVSDLKISRTARVPGRKVPLRSMESSLVIDAAKATGTVPSRLLGALHPGGTPAQTRAALHVIRTDKILTATPMRRGARDADHPSPGKSGKFSYDWQVCDRVFDWMAAHGVEPYISIDSTPSILGGSVPPFSGERLETGLSSSSGFGPQPPDSLADWGLVVEDFVHHVVREKGYRVPYWGVWNEPDFGAFWNAGVERYLDLYAVTARAVRSVDPKARVGGPESGYQEKWIRPLIERCAKEKLPLDFVSYHDYSGNLVFSYIRVSPSRIVADFREPAQPFQ